MGDIDGLTGTMANVSAYTIKNSTGLVLPYDVWHSEIRKDINIYEKVAQNITFKQESHIEALLAWFHAGYRQPSARISAFVDQVLLQTQLCRLESDAGSADGYFNRCHYFSKPDLCLIDAK